MANFLYIKSDLLQVEVEYSPSWPLASPSWRADKVTATNTGIPPDTSGARSTGPPHGLQLRTSTSNLRRKLYYTPDDRPLTSRRADVMSPFEKTPGPKEHESVGETRGGPGGYRAAWSGTRSLSCVLWTFSSLSWETCPSLRQFQDDFAHVLVTLHVCMGLLDGSHGVDSVQHGQ